MTKIRAAIVLWTFANASQLWAEPMSPSTAANVPAQTSEISTQSEQNPPLLPRDTPIHLMVTNEVTTKTHSAGHRFRLRVDQPVMINNVVAVPVGTTAWGEVLSAESSGNIGKPGSLAARVLFIDLNGRHIAIGGETSSRGKGGGAEAAMGVLALGPLGLFAKGNNAKIKAGERMTAFTINDFPLGAQPQISTAATAPANQ